MTKAETYIGLTCTFISTRIDLCACVCSGILNEYLQEKEEDINEDAVDPSPSSQDDEPGTADDGNDAILKNCFSDIVSTLSNTNPK